MNLRLVERQLALAGIALVAVLATIALVERRAAGDAPPAPPPAATWYEAEVGTFGSGFYGTTTTCDVRLTRRTSGVAHPVLPCGARLVVAHGGREVETLVIDRASHGTGQAFALSEALAAELGVAGTETVRWRFSSGPR